MGEGVGLIHVPGGGAGVAIRCEDDPLIGEVGCIEPLRLEGLAFFACDCALRAREDEILFLHRGSISCGPQAAW